MKTHQLDLVDDESLMRHIVRMRKAVAIHFVTEMDGRMNDGVLSVC
jgi:hypothetical protein